ncbi:hypothetical protein A2165_01805 [Candidatus Curtissbacteria bacterium RBG_13_40_7]|uniref:Dockerin domain-containing protein n=1 Tax=Candidatus Curtissbacteria bacterium RBG_13_40_7 TaxID=1797706 RepID=A0A1F5FWN2_9BACT|nr:MAG: hypothetical protein A2165_01805 [Candidatus Curtissbacteria bacterium RBG_13_40_7]
MNALKDFFKPNLWKVILFLILPTFYVQIGMAFCAPCPPEVFCGFCSQPHLLVPLPLAIFSYLSFRQSPFLSLALGIIFSYLLSNVIYFLIKKIKSFLLSKTLKEKIILIFLTLATLVIFVLAVYFYIQSRSKMDTVTQSKPSQISSINSFEDCSKAGNPILETYPRQCKTADGKSFTEIILQESLDAPRCDVNSDGKCNAGDLDLLNKVFGKSRGEKDYIPLADLDADGVINEIDKQMLLKLLDQNQPDETVNWKTYKNQNLGFSVKYPLSLSTHEIDEGVNITNGETTESKFIGIKIVREDTGNKISLEGYLNSKYPVNDYGIPSYQSGNDKGYFKEVTIGGLQGLLNQNGMQFENKEKVAWVKPNNYVFISTAYNIGETGTEYTEEAGQIFNQILSTFKFID